MRSKDVIWKEQEEYPTEQKDAKLTIEILLDIRDLLSTSSTREPYQE